MSHTTRRLAALFAAVILLPVVAVVPVAATTSAIGGPEINVTTLADSAADDGSCSLREAITAANTNSASGATTGECPAGSSSATDMITFSVAGAITETSYLPEITSDLTIDGGSKITISGANLYRPITVISGTVAVKNMTVTAGRDTVAFGGGIYNGNAATMTLTNMAVTGSTSTFGGGILSWGTLTINDSTVSGNTSNSGGGVFSLGTATITNSTIAGNSAGSEGGGLLINQGTAIVTGSTISGNSADNGGGVRNRSDATLSIANSTLSGNTTTSFSGAISNSGTVTVTNTTIAGNSAGISVGGLNDDSSSTVVNSIIAGNTPDNVSSGIDATTASLIGVSTTGLLDPAGLADNGGPTKTIRLLATAASAIDQGDATACAASPVSGTDQRGVTRSATCDIGAYEIEHTAPTVTAPAATLRSGVQLSGSALPVHLAWSGADNATVDHYVLARSTNGGPWTTVSSSISKPSYDLFLAKSSAYRFRVKAVDPDGNVSSTVARPTFGALLVQQSSSKVKYNASWTNSSKVSFSGGSARYKKTKGASATFTFTGRSIAFVTTKGPGRGKAKIYINGTYVTTIDLYASSNRYRVLAYQKTWSTGGTRKIKIVVSGTGGRPRVDIDAFAVLK